MIGRNAGAAPTTESVRTMRENFDRSFATAANEKPGTVGLLAIRVGGASYAVRLDEVASLHKDDLVVPVPNAAPGLLGMAGFRGVVAAVYDLGVFLGHPPAEAHPWLVLARAAVPVAFAFAAFEAYRLVETGDLPLPGGSGARPHLDGALRETDGTRALIRLASVVETIVSRARSSGPEKDW